MLCKNTDARLIEEIEQQTGIKCVEGLRHLGIEVRKTYKSTVEATNAKILQQTQIFPYMIELFTPERISPDWPFKGTQRLVKISILTPWCAF